MPTARDIQIMAAEARNKQASRWMKTGLALVQEGDPASLAQAVRLFADAIALREQLPLDDVPVFRHGLAAGFMNRADALSRLSPAHHFDEIIRSYDAAIRHLDLLPRNQNPLFTRRHAIAWLNRGEVLLSCGHAAASTQSFEACLAILESPCAQEIEDRLELLGCAWLNRARAALENEPPNHQTAAAAARHALLALRAAEKTSALAAEAALKSRLTLCRALAALAETSQTPGPLIDEATDAAEEGLALARAWETGAAATRLHPLALDLFRFAAQAYQTHQPHFLPEFVLEAVTPAEANSTPDINLRHEATLALQRAFQSLLAQGFAALDSPSSRHLLAQLRAAESKLAPCA